MRVRINNISKDFGTFRAVSDCSLDVADGELVTLLGPSGCGKTTLLRMIAGLLTPETGRIYLDQKDVTREVPQQRKTAMVFQHYALFPNLTVGENIAFGLKAAKMNRAEIAHQVEQSLERVELTGYAGRQVDELSGGQRQRVALARALAVKPGVLLLDEPLSNLDEKLRQSMRRSIRAIQQELGITTVYVTHDQQEAMAISDRIVVMNQGVIQQIGTPEEIYHQPQNAFVADFIGHANIIPVTVDQCYGKVALVSVFGNIKEVRTAGEIGSGCTGFLVVRPESIRIVESGYPAVIKWVERLGSVHRYTVDIFGVSMIVDQMSKGIGSYLLPESKISVAFEWEGVLLIAK